MQIICVAHSYPRSETDVAGAFIERLNIALRERNHSIKVIAPSERGSGQRERLRGISVSRVRYAPTPMETLAYQGDMRERAASPLGALAAASLMIAQATEIGHLNGVARADVVHAHWWVPGGVSAWMARLVLRVPYVVTLHGTDVDILNRSFFGRGLARRVLRGAAVVTAVSSYLADSVARTAGLDATKIVVQPMPIDVDRFTRASRGGDGVVTVGRLTKQKNLDVVLEALARLKEMGREPSLKIIGDGPRRDALEQRAKGLGLVDQVHFMGAVAPEEIPRAIGNADVMVFPAIREGLGLVAAEALMLGVPVVAAESGGGIKDIVPASGAGRLVRASDPKAMAEAIAGFLDNPGALHLASRAGETLRQRLAPATVAKVFEGVYNKAAATRKRRSNA